MRKRNGLNRGPKVLRKVAAAILAAVVVASSMPANANAEGTPLIKDKYLTEDRYDYAMENTVVPYIDSIKKTGYLTGEKDMKLYYEKYKNPNATATMVICHGMGESLEKYDEMIYYYLQLGYSVYGMEHRGHGRSGRLGVDATQVSVDSFQYYINDLKKFLDQIVLKESNDKPLYLYAHSMGGAIGTEFLEQHPEYFRAAILSSPMLGINTNFVPKWLARLVADGLANSGLKDKYIAGSGEWEASYNFEKCHASSEIRYKRQWQAKVDHEELRMGGGSYKWASESLNATNKLMKESEVKKIKIPVLVFQAGKDNLVDNSCQDTFIRYNTGSKLIRYEDSKHELYSQKEDELLDYYTNVFEFLNEMK